MQLENRSLGMVASALFQGVHGWHLVGALCEQAVPWVHAARQFLHLHRPAQFISSLDSKRMTCRHLLTRNTEGRGGGSTGTMMRASAPHPRLSYSSDTDTFAAFLHQRAAGHALGVACRRFWSTGDARAQRRAPMLARAALSGARRPHLAPREEGVAPSRPAKHTGRRWWPHDSPAIPRAPF